MAYIGMKYPIFVPITEEPDNAVPVYGNGIVLGHAISADIKTERANKLLMADDGVVETYKGVRRNNINRAWTISAKKYTKVWFGAEEDETGAIIDKGDVTSPFGGYGYYSVRKNKKSKSFQHAFFFLLQNTVFSR